MIVWTFAGPCRARLSLLCLGLETAVVRLICKNSLLARPYIGHHPFSTGWVTPFGRELFVRAVAFVRVRLIFAAVANGERPHASSIAALHTPLLPGAAEGTFAGALISGKAFSALVDTVLGGAGVVEEIFDGLCRHDGFGGVDSLRWWRR